jgi:hypothetical protein
MTKLNPVPKTKLFYGQACVLRWKGGGDGDEDSKKG